MQTFRRTHKKQSGFTLMELLIVISVLGLMLGVLTPRLGGIIDNVAGTLCDTNKKNVRHYTQMFLNKTTSLPDGLTNLVDDDGVALPSKENSDVDGAEAICGEFWTRNRPGLYQLDAAEVEELADMGITTVYNLNAGNGTRMNKEPLVVGESVAMMGIAFDGADYSYTGDGTNTVDDGILTIGNPSFIGRIMLALNDRCGLVEKGYIQASPLCPHSLLAKDDYTFQHYVIVLPRLQATVDNLVGTLGGLTAGTPLVFTMEGDTEEVEVEFEAQDSWNFDVSSPEGRRWPDYRGGVWIATSGL